MRLVACMIVVGLLAAFAYAQDSAPQPDRQPSGPHNGQQPLTADQKAQVKSILSKYDEASLTAGDAHAINDAFRAAGLRGGFALQQAIQEAGFDPQRISTLDPPPDRPSGPPQDRRQANDPGRARRDTYVQACSHVARRDLKELSFMPIALHQAWVVLNNSSVCLPVRTTSIKDASRSE